ncbi:MAG: nucleotidyltransferase family protein, partial [Deltaproteobacteria bacterium]
MNRNDAIKTLASVKTELAGRFGVSSLALFGSTARGQARQESDIDVLVAFDGPATSAKYFGALFLLEDTFGCRIDLVTEKALRP